MNLGLSDFGIENGGIILSEKKKKKKKKKKEEEEEDCHHMGKDKYSMCLKQMPLILKEKDKYSTG